MKKVISILFSFVLLLGIAPFALASSYKDVSSTYRFYEEVTYLNEKGIISGFQEGTFRPDIAVTRAQAAIMIGRALGLDGTKQNTKFPDVSENSVASGYIQSAVNAGIIQGFPDGTFKPNQSVTRGQLAIFLSRAFNLQETAKVSFKDVSSTSAAYPYIGKILARGITAGYMDNTYKPDQAVTRGQFSAFMARTLDPVFIKKLDEEKKVSGWLGEWTRDTVNSRAVLTISENSGDMIDIEINAMSGWNVGDVKGTAKIDGNIARQITDDIDTGCFVEIEKRDDGLVVTQLADCLTGLGVHFNGVYEDEAKESNTLPLNPEEKAVFLVKKYVNNDSWNYNVDHQKSNGDYMVRVYTIVPNESGGEYYMTFGWYGVNVQTGHVYHALQNN